MSVLCPPSLKDAGAAGEQQPFQETVKELTRAHHQELARLDALLTDVAKQQTQKRQELDNVTAELTRQRPLAEAKRQGRWWSGL